MANRRLMGFDLPLENPGGYSVRAWNNAMREGWYAIGVYHDQIVQPAKFKPEAARRYGFQTRSPKYVIAKKKAAAKSWRVKSGGELDLVLSGKTRTAVLQTQLPRAFPTRVSLEIPTYSYVSMRPKKAGRPNLGEELVSIDASDRESMEKVFVQAAEAELLKWGGGRRT